MTRGNQKHRSKGISSPSLLVAEQLRQWEEPQLKEGELYTGLRAYKLNLANQDAKGIEFDRVDLDCSDLNGTKIANFKLRDSRLGQCNLANADWHGAQIARVEMTECRMLGLKITEGKL